MAETRTDRDAQNKVWDMIRHIKVATMVTLDAQGHFRGRPPFSGCFVINIIIGIIDHTSLP